MSMQASWTESLPPPPGVFGSLKAGFDTISTHLTVLLLPLVLDLLLWLGPRLSIKAWLMGMLPQLVEEWQRWGVSAEQIKLWVESYPERMSLLGSYNILAVLRTFPIGITSLLSGRTLDSTPLGQPQVWQLAPAENIMGSLLLLVFIGWLGGAVYFRWVASLVIPAGGAVRFKAVVQSLLLSFAVAAALLVIGTPLALLLFVFLAVSPLLANVALVLIGFIGMWFIVPLFFAGHGIFMRSQTALASVISGIRMARFTLPNSSMFVMSVLIISMLMNYLWIIPAPDSWMLLVGILGHAFITTALLAASFIYYRDMNSWLQTVFERLQAEAASTKDKLQA